MNLAAVRRTLVARGIMGMNQRNGLYVGPLDPRGAYPTVDDKRLTKRLAAGHGIPIPEMYGVIERQRQVRELPALVADRQAFVVKPARGAAGNGIVLIAGHDAERLTTPSGETLSWEALTYHVASILSGIYSLEGLEDQVLIEALIRVDRTFEAVTY